MRFESLCDLAVKCRKCAESMKLGGGGGTDGLGPPIPPQLPTAAQSPPGSAERERTVSLQSLSGRATALVALHVGAVAPVADQDISGKEQATRDVALQPAVAYVRGAGSAVSAVLEEATTAGSNPGASALAGATLSAAGVGGAMSGALDDVSPAQAAALGGGQSMVEDEHAEAGTRVMMVGAGQALGAAAVGSDQGIRLLVCGPQRGGPLLPPSRAAVPGVAEAAVRLLQGEASQPPNQDEDVLTGADPGNTKPEGMISVAVARAAAAVATAIETGSGPAGRSLGPAFHYASLGRAADLVLQGQTAAASEALAEAVEAALRQRDVVCAAAAAGLRAAIVADGDGGGRGMLPSESSLYGWECGDSAVAAAVQQTLSAFSWR